MISTNGLGNRLRAGWDGIVPHSSFLRRLLLLSGGTLVGQLVVVASSPIITRLFTPADLGALTVFSAIVACLGAAVGLRFEMAVPLVRRDDEAAAVTVLSLVTITVLTAVTAAAVTLWPAGAAGGFVDDVAPWLWLVAPCLMLWGIGLPLGYWSIRRGTFTDNAVNRALQYVVQTVAQIGLGVLGMGTSGLIWGYFAGLLARSLHFIVRLRRADFTMLAAVRPPAMLAMVRRHWRYPVFSSPSALLENVSQFLPVLLLATSHGVAVAGWFGLAHRLLDLPVRLLSNSASEVFLGELGRTVPSMVHRLYVKTLSRFFVIGGIGALAAMLLAPWGSAFVFGEAWRPVGTMIQVLLPLQVARFAVIPVSQTLYALQRHDLHFLAATLGVIATGGSFAAGWAWDMSPAATVLLYSVTSAGAFALYAALAFFLSRPAAEVETTRQLVL